MEIVHPREQVLAAYVRGISNRFNWAFEQALAGDPAELLRLLNRIVVRSGGVFQDASFLRRVWRAIQWFTVDPQRPEYLAALTATVASLTPTGSRHVLLQAQLRFSLGELDRAFDLAVNLREQGYRSSQLDCLLKVRSKSIAPMFPDFNAEKIFGIGLPRTGTTSLTEALNRLDYHAVHLLNPHTQNLISWDDFLRFDAFTDSSVAHCFETLYHTFPNAKFIYTTRNIRDWTNSTASENHRISRAPLPDDLFRISRHWLFPHFLQISQSLFCRFPTWEAAYRAHDQRVRSFFHDKPADKFLELPICDGAGFKELCEFLGRPLPVTPFPYINARPDQAPTVPS